MEILRILGRNRFFGPLLICLGVVVVVLLFNIDIFMGEARNDIGPKTLAAAALTISAVSGLLYYEMQRRFTRLNFQTERVSEMADRLSNAIEALNDANADLRQSEERYRELVENQDALIVRRDTDGRLTFVNNTFCEHFALDPQEAQGGRFYPNIHPEDRGIFESLRDGLTMPPYRIRYDQRVLTQDGWRWIAWVDYAIHDDKGDVREIQSIGRDVTDRRAAEEQLKIARDEAEAANKAKSSFLAMVSHEIRTPMNGILGMNKLLRETELTDQQHGYADAVSRSGEALMAIINDLLDYSKVEAGKLALEDHPFNLIETVEQACELLAARAVEKDVAIGVTFDVDVPEFLHGDAGRLRQVILNLGGNAIKFTDAGGVMISVSVTSKSETAAVLLFEVKDTGIGIAEDVQEAMFEEFSQADTGSTRRYGGTGLGLAISRRIVEAMKGQIGVDSVVNEGSTFWFMVDQGMLSDPETEDAGDTISAETLAGRNMLLCDGNEISRQIIARNLRILGAKVEAYSNADETRNAIAAAEARGETIDALLVDGNLHEGAITGLGSTIGDSPAGKDCRLVLLLQVDQHTILEPYRESGYGYYLVRPIRRRTLVRVLTASAEDQQEWLDPRMPSENTAVGDGDAKAPACVLLAEDNRINQMLAETLLHRLGLDTECVENGREAVEAVQRGDFSLVLMDVNMPVVDGLQATREIRALETGKSAIPIIAMTASAMDEDRQRCAAAGMNDYIAKPVEEKELQRLIAQWTNIQTSASNTP